MADHTGFQDDALNVDHDDDSTFEEVADSTATLSSSIFRYRTENGRTYHAYEDGKYVVPNDNQENERLNLQHQMFDLTFKGKLQLAPIDGLSVHQALDVGTGTGIWAIDFADDHPETHVTGIDLSPTQPQMVPPNVEFVVDDIERWDFSHKYDYIHVRNMTGSIPDWPKFMQKAYETLTPGGYIEIIDMIFPVKCDDGSLAEHSALMEWTRKLSDTMERAGRPLDSALHYSKQLKGAGFEGVVEQRFKWPSNGWPKHPHKELGIWNCCNMNEGMQGFSLAPLTRRELGNSWTPVQVEVFLTQVRRDLKDRSIHAYWEIRDVYARKPAALE